MDKTCCPLYTIKCEALNFKPTKSQKKVVKKFVNYILNDIKPGGGGSNEATKSNDDDEEVSSAVPDNMQEKTEKMEGNLQLKEMVSIANDVPNVQDNLSEEAKSDTYCDMKPVDRAGTKHAMGMDPSKPRQGKAKLRRLEKWKAKHADGRSGEVPRCQNKEKSIEDLLEPLENAENSKHKWEVRLVRASDDDKTFTATLKDTVKVYQNYQRVIHNDSPDKCTEKQFKRFLCNSPLQLDSRGPPFGSYHYQYCIDGEIFAVGVLDILPHCVSSVYLYYDPKYTFLSPGTLTSLLEISLVRKLAKTFPTISFYYLGFYIHNCVKMRYKGRYSPSHLLCPEAYTWQPLSLCRDILDKSSYSRLEPDSSKHDKDANINHGQIGVLYCRQATTYSNYQAMLRDEGDDEDGDKEEVEEYASLVGDTIAKRMLLYRAG